MNEEAQKRNGSLPGMGGVYNIVNLHLYHYAANNPVKYIDPDGKEDIDPEIQARIDDIVKNGARIGEEVFIMAGELDFNRLVENVIEKEIMGKKWEENKYVCTTFVNDAIKILGLEPSDFIENNSVGDSISKFKKELSTIEPASGLYVFYKKSDNVSHVGLVYFDENNGQKILHNGASNDGSNLDKVNLRNRKTSTPFYAFFGSNSSKDSVYFKPVINRR